MQTLLRENLTVYDAASVAMAEAHGVALLTADRPRGVTHCGQLIDPVRRGSRPSRGSRLLPRTPPASLVRDHGTVEEQLPSPDTPRLATLERTCEALVAYGTETTQGLGDIDMLRPFGEPQVRVEVGTRDDLT